MEEVCRQQAPSLSNWDELIGHQQERRRLIQGGYSTSLLFSGAQGLGKCRVAAWYAAHLNCQNPPLDSPWNCQCLNCRRVLKNNHPDVVWLERLPGKLSLGVGEVRELIQQLYLRPYQARARVCIISEAERLTDEAQSALLKTLEEPPDFNVLILVTSQESKLLATVQSRCQIHRFRPVDNTTLMQWLQTRGCPSDLAARYTALSQGSPGRALAFWEQPALGEALEQLFDCLQELPGTTLARCLELAGQCETLKAPGLEGRALLEWILYYAQTYFRDVLLVKTGVSHVINVHRRQQLQQLAQKKSDVQPWILALHQAQGYAGANVNIRLLLQDLFLKLSQ